jgi:hypothetical protein
MVLLILFIFIGISIALDLIFKSSSNKTKMISARKKEKGTVSNVVLNPESVIR